MSDNYFLQIETAALDESQYMTVRCQKCNIHYPLRAIKAHMDTHSSTTQQEAFLGN